MKTLEQCLQTLFWFLYCYFEKLFNVRVIFKSSLNLTCIWNMSICCSEIIKLVTFFLFDLFWIYLNPFVPNVPFLYLLKTSENRKFSGGWRKGTLRTNGLKDKFGCFKTKPMLRNLKLIRLLRRCNLREAPWESGRVV